LFFVEGGGVIGVSVTTHTVKHRGGYVSITATEEGVMVTHVAGAKLGEVKVSMLTPEQAGALSNALAMAVEDFNSARVVTS
jgi:hypothetical protein